MAIAHATGNVWLAATANATSVNRAFVNAVTAGSLLVAVEFYATDEAQTISDSNGNTWQVVHTPTFHGNLANGLTIWRAQNANSGATTVTASGATSNSRTLVICEYTGAHTTAANDGTPVSDSADGVSSNPDPGAITTTAAGVIVGATLVYPTANPTAGASFTSRFNTAAAGSLYNLAIEDWLTPSAQVGNHPSWATAEDYWLALGVGFKEASGGGGGATGRGRLVGGKLVGGNLLVRMQ